MQRLGRKTLLALSASGAFLSLVGVGFGLDSGLVALASITILTFVACAYNLSYIFSVYSYVVFRSFAIGIGPVPFVMIPEVSPLHVCDASFIAAPILSGNFRPYLHCHPWVFL